MKRPSIRWATTILATMAAMATLYMQGHLTPRAELVFKDPPGPEAPGFVAALAGLTNSVVAPGRVTGAWNTPDGYFGARLAAIRGAQSVIRFETFFMTPGRRADAFADALIARARAGVAVSFIADKAGCEMPAAYWQRLREGGVDVRFYHPFDWRTPLRYNSRTHRKLLLVDHRIALTGGAGVSDNWDGVPERGDSAPWCEWEFQLEGPVVRTLEGVFMQHWAVMGGEVALTAAAPAPEDGDTQVVVTAGSPADDESTTRLLYQATLSSAKKRLWIASPYFLPDSSAREVLTAARRKGVDVRILTEGPKNDKPYAYQAMRAQYGELLEAGVVISEHQPSFMHAKAMLVDDQWVSFGSANFDPRSFYQNDELTFSISSVQVSRQVESFFNTAFAQSRPVDLAAWRATPWHERVTGQAAWLFRFQL